MLDLLVGAEAEAGAQLSLEDVEGRDAPVTTIAAIGLGEDPLQQAVL